MVRTYYQVHREMHEGKEAQGVCPGGGGSFIVFVKVFGMRVVGFDGRDVWDPTMIDWPVQMLDPA